MRFPPKKSAIMWIPAYFVCLAACSIGRIIRLSVYQQQVKKQPRFFSETGLRRLELLFLLLLSSFLFCHMCFIPELCREKYVQRYSTLANSIDRTFTTRNILLYFPTCSMQCQCGKLKTSLNELYFLLQLNAKLFFDNFFYFLRQQDHIFCLSFSKIHHKIAMFG